MGNVGFTSLRTIKKKTSGGFYPENVSSRKIQKLSQLRGTTALNLGDSFNPPLNNFAPFLAVQKRRVCRGQMGSRERADC